MSVQATKNVVDQQFIAKNEWVDQVTYTRAEIEYVAIKFIQYIKQTSSFCHTQIISTTELTDLCLFRRSMEANKRYR